MGAAKIHVVRGTGCARFGVPRRAITYTPTKAVPKVDPRLADPITDWTTAFCRQNPKRALVDGSVPRLGRARWQDDACAGDRLSHSRASGLASLLIWQGHDGRQRLGACADCPVWHARQGPTGVPTEVGQWPGLHEPKIHSLGEKLWPEAGVHHAPLPAAERHDRACDPDPERAMRPSPALRQHPARDTRHRRLDQLLQPQAPSPSACH